MMIDQKDAKSKVRRLKSPFSHSPLNDTKFRLEDGQVNQKFPKKCVRKKRFRMNKK